MEEQYISKLHPVVDYGAGVFLLIIGEFCLHSLLVCLKPRTRHTGAALAVLQSVRGSWREKIANLFPHRFPCLVPSGWLDVTIKSLLSDLQFFVSMLKT